MKYLSVCSGIEAATVAWHGLGWTPVAFSEIEPFPSAVLAHHYPHVPNLGDMTKFKEWNIDLSEVDILVGGTPCQAFSIAGNRKSLADARGNLSLTYIQLLDAIDEQRNKAGKLPTICLWENVHGVFSTKDNAFGCFLAGMVGEDMPLQAPRKKWQNAGVVVGPERLAAWRVFDAQFFGVAQRRRRCFLVSVSLRHPRAWAIAESLLPVIESEARTPAPQREKRSYVPPGASSSTDKVICLASAQANAELRVDSAPSLTCLHEVPIITSPVAFKVRGGCAGGGKGYLGSEDCTFTLSTTHDQDLVVPFTMDVRRLTPTEFERLQGFPDGYTAIPWRKSGESPDGPRYKALGNSMAVPCMRHIGERLATQLGNGNGD